MLMRYGNRLAVIVLTGLCLAWGARAQHSADDALASLDRSARPVYVTSLGIIPDAEVEDLGTTATMEFGADWQFAYFANVLGADVDLNLVSDWIFYTDDAGAGIPDQLISVSLDAGATWRYVNDSALETRLKPTFNGDFEEIDGDPFYVPFSIVFRKGFNPDMAGQIGLDIRPGFERVVLPVVGMAFRLHERVYAQAGLPESQIIYYATPSIVPYARLDWQSVTYALREKSGIADREFTVEDFRLYGGLRVRLSEELHLAGEVGRVFGRDFEADPPPTGVDREVTAEDTLFFRFAVMGPF